MAMNTKTWTKLTLAVALAGATAIASVGSAPAAPVLTSTATVKHALPSDVQDVRWWGWGGGAFFGGLVAGGLSGAAIAQPYYYGYPAYGYSYGYGSAPYAYGYSYPYAYPYSSDAYAYPYGGGYYGGGYYGGGYYGGGYYGGGWRGYGLRGYALRGNGWRGGAYAAHRARYR